MASPPPNQPSSSSGMTEAIPFWAAAPRGGPTSHRLRQVTALPMDIAPEYIDFLIYSAIDTAEDVPYDHEDLQRERDRPLSLEPPLFCHSQPPVGTHGEMGEEGGAERLEGLRKSTKRRLEEVESPNKPPTPPTASPEVEGSKKRPKNLGRRRREKEEKRAYREQHGWCASPRVRNKMSTVVSSEKVEFSMMDGLVEGTQLGGYRPRAEKREKEIIGMMARMKGAYNGMSESPAEDVLGDLKAMGYEVISWDGLNPILLTDTEERVFAALVGQPADATWGSRCMELYDLMMKDQEKVKSLPRRNHVHRRGKYATVGTGVTFAPGDKTVHNLHLTVGEKQLIYGMSEKRWKIKSDLRKFAETSFDLFAPRLYRYYVAHMKKLHQHPDYTHLQHGNPYERSMGPEPEGFASHAENQPPSAFTVPHRDVMNLAFGWCAIIALGPFDAQLGGHLVLHDLKRIIPFPHGSLILIPSAFLWHSNVPIQKQDGRASITFFSSGGLFRFIDNGFQTERAYVSLLDKQDRESHQIKKRDRARIGVSLYSKLSEILHPEHADLHPISF